jgi:cyclophilin family peptidyl-prolyl cis-trans isomerase
MSRNFEVAAALAGLLLMTACSRAPEKKAEAEKAPPPAEAPAKPAGGTFKVKLDTSDGPVLVEVHRDWAPIGAQRFEELVKAKYFDGARFFRIVPNFVVQFGIASNPAATKKWDNAIKDDPVTQTNRRGSLAFATMGPNTRTAQIFINLRTNQNLDADGFAPFAMVVEGMDVVDKFYAAYGERPRQDLITRQGNSYLASNFPNLDYIKTATIVP